MIIAAIIFTILGLVLIIGAILNSRQSTNPKNTKTSAILVSVGMANIALGMAFVALHFVG